MSSALAHRARFNGENSGFARWSLAVAGLFLSSAALQLIASLERWVLFRDSWARDDISVEDGLFDYYYPSDPWENLGSTAQLSGAGTVLTALGVLAMARAVPGGTALVDRALIVIVASSFGLSGTHALLSGLIGTPSVLQALQLVPQLAGTVPLLLLGGRLMHRSWSGAISCLFLLGATAPGYLVATFIIAPAIAGYQSHDTTPWTETIVAVWMACAGVAMAVQAGSLAVSRRRSLSAT
jgi:hypothetical protein